MHESNRRYLFFIFAALFPLYLLFTFDHSLWNPDETRDAGIARSMYVDKNFVTPHLNGEPFLEKPPLYYWSTSLVYAVTGRVTAGTTRLPAALFGLLGLLFTFLIGQRLFNPRVGFMAAAMLGTSIQYFRMSHCALMDSSLAACVTAAFYFYLVQSNFLFLLATIFAFYAKGFVAIAMIGLVMTLDLMLKRKPKQILIISLQGLILFTLLVSPWIYFLWKDGGASALRVFFIDNNFHRFTSAAADHADNSFFMYFLSFPGDFMPWTFLFLAAFARFLFKERFSSLAPERRFLYLWFGLIFIFLTLSLSKRSIYLLPAFPAAALIAAVWLDDFFSRPMTDRFSSLMTFATWMLIPFLAIAVFAGAIIRLHQYIVPVLGLAFVLVLIQRFIGDLRARSGFMAFIGAFLLLFVSYAGADFFFIRQLDQDKSFVPLCDEVKQEMASQHINRDNIAGFDMSEMERGVFSFYLEGNIRNLKNPNELDQWLLAKRDMPSLLLTNRNNVKRLSAEAATKLQPTFLYRPDKKTRSYVLYSRVR